MASLVGNSLAKAASVTLHRTSRWHHSEFSNTLCRSRFCKYTQLPGQTDVSYDLAGLILTTNICSPRNQTVNGHNGFPDAFGRCCLLGLNLYFKMIDIFLS